MTNPDEPAFTMGRAAELIGVTPAFLRTLDETGLIEPERSLGGHRRYSAHQLDLAARVRTLLDDGFLLAAACRVVTLEDRLAAAHRRILDLGGRLGPGEDATIPTQTRRGAPTRTRRDAPAPTPRDTPARARRDVSPPPALPGS